MATITNYWKKLPVTGDWDWHLKHGYLGGTDYETTSGDAVRAPVTGTISFVGNGLTPGQGVALTYDTGRSVQLLELASHSVTAGQKVTRGQTIGKAGARYLHIHIVIDGVRHDWNPYITPALAVLAVGAVKTLIAPKLAMEETMLLLNPTGGTLKDKACIIIGDTLFCGIPGTEYTAWKAQGVTVKRPNAADMGTIVARFRDNPQLKLVK